MAGISNLDEFLDCSQSSDAPVRTFHPLFLWYHLYTGNHLRISVTQAKKNVTNFTRTWSRSNSSFHCIKGVLHMRSQLKVGLSENKSVKNLKDAKNIDFA